MRAQERQIQLNGYREKSKIKKSKCKITHPMGTMKCIKNLKFLKVFLFLLFITTYHSFAQEPELEFTLDVSANTTTSPQIFRPNIDLSGRGFHRLQSWPQALAAQEVLNLWQKEIGFKGIYRLQYNLWEIHELAKHEDLQANLLRNYENIIKQISDAGGIVILNIFGTPAGLGRVLDKKSAALNLKAYKALIKSQIKYLSCEKKYNLWYEVWTAPDLDDFFLGRKQEYLNLYRVVAEAIKELESSTKIHIPIGGPSTSWWFQNFDGNTIITPERSLIYELIKFCRHYKLPLDFITWHAYSTDPKVETETTRYNKTAVALIRDWLSYFDFDRNTPLMVDEWNYDSGGNVLPERKESAYVGASYILSRLKNLSEAGLDNQVYFSLEDFQNNKEGVIRNTGIFWFDAYAPRYKGGPKSIYNVFRMLAHLGNQMFVLPKLSNEFVGILATKTPESITVFIYNYIDPQIAQNYLSRNIASLNDAERKALLKLLKSDTLEKILQRKIEVTKMRLSHKLKTVLKKAQDLNDQATKFKDASRNLKISIKNLKKNYLYQRYVVDSACSANCEFVPVEEKEIAATDLYQETLVLNPYSVQMIILKEKPPEPPPALPPTPEEPKAQNITDTALEKGK
jgi:hypothetical protein